MVGPLLGASTSCPVAGSERISAGEGAEQMARSWGTGTEDKIEKEFYQAERLASVQVANDALDAYIGYLESILAARLEAIDFLGPEEQASLSYRAPHPSLFEPPKPTLLSKLWGPGRSRYEEAREQGRLAFEEAKATYEEWMTWRGRRAAEKKAEPGHREDVNAYFCKVLEASLYPKEFPHRFRLSFVRESSQLVVEYELPPFAVVPEVASYRYKKTADEITSSSRPITSRQKLYREVISQITVRTLYELFAADRSSLLDIITFNGVVDTIDRATGKPARPCLITVRVIRETFLDRDFSQVEAVACLKSLYADVSKSPSEYLPVRPVIQFNMVDPRFIAEIDILSHLDNRPNLLDLGWGEFEHLIQNLFQKMGFEAKATRPSRDGGVDCVAFDESPIRGMKVVIQAKRYSQVVPVSAVRDLYGSMNHERAAKGILVTTSDYSPAAYEFANDKPIELIRGSGLLWLLENHTGLKAKIEPKD
jgi:restriction system protein